MIEKLEELGLQVDRAPLAERGAAGKPIGRPHIAQAVHRHPANVARLEAEGLSQDPSDALVPYLIPGAPAYVRRTRPTVSEAIALIHAAGGVAVWAHPFWDIDDPERVTQTLARFTEEAGLDGVEAFYATHTEDQTHLQADQADELGLLTTGSADFHGPDHPLFSAFRAFDLHGREPRLGPCS
jgi:predicted metal-dependent phosphoesterase TrpH